MNLTLSYNQVFSILKSEANTPDFSFHRIELENEILNEYSIYQLHSTINDRTCPGLGVDRNKTLAIIKAVFEYFERRALIENGFPRGIKSTNGMAAHLVSDKALETAKEELIERDALLMHWYTQTPFISTNKNKTSFLEKYLSPLKAQNKQAYFAKTTLGMRPTHLCFIINKTGGFTLGLSSKKSEKEAIEKAFSEALINEYFGQTTHKTEKLEMDINNGIFDSLIHHRHFWKEKMTIPKWALENGQELKENLNEGEFTTSLSVKFGPIHVHKVSHADLLDLNLGLPTDASLSIVEKRLSNIKQKPTIVNKFETIHPIP